MPVGVAFGTAVVAAGSAAGVPVVLSVAIGVTITTDVAPFTTVAVGDAAGVVAMGLLVSVGEIIEELAGVEEGGFAGEPGLVATGVADSQEAFVKLVIVRTSVVDTRPSPTKSGAPFTS